ncbi:hypothetical protein HK405_005479, partial [Cladochytrium tenue]
MQAAGYTAVRIFINTVAPNAKGSSASWVEDVEATAVGQYNDTILELIDDLMVRASAYHIKLIIALHDRYSLGFYESDGYYAKYASAANFYTDAAAIADFDRRIAHILSHQNAQAGNAPWSALSQYILAVEPENEPFGQMAVANADWWCGRCAAVRNQLATPSILVASGGGVDLPTSMDPHLLLCPAVDVIAVHNYVLGGGLATAAAIANAHGKRLVVEEFGSNSADPTTKGAQLAAFGREAVAAGVPFFPWEVMIPGNPSDYEFSPNDPAWGALQSVVADAQGAVGLWTWPE